MLSATFKCSYQIYIIKHHLHSLTNNNDRALTPDWSDGLNVSDSKWRHLLLNKRFCCANVQRLWTKNRCRLWWQQRLLLHQRHVLQNHVHSRQLQTCRIISTTLLNIFAVMANPQFWKRLIRGLDGPSGCQVLKGLAARSASPMPHEFAIYHIMHENLNSFFLLIFTNNDCHKPVFGTQLLFTCNSLFNTFCITSKMKEDALWYHVYEVFRHGHPSVLFCSLAFLDPRVGHTMDVLSPFISMLCHSDW